MDAVHLYLYSSKTGLRTAGHVGHLLMRPESRSHLLKGIRETSEPFFHGIMINKNIDWTNTLFNVLLIHASNLPYIVFKANPHNLTREIESSMQCMHRVVKLECILHSF